MTSYSVGRANWGDEGGQQRTKGDERIEAYWDHKPTQTTSLLLVTGQFLDLPTIHTPSPNIPHFKPQITYVLEYTDLGTYCKREEKEKKKKNHRMKKPLSPEDIQRKVNFWNSKTNSLI